MSGGGRGTYRGGGQKDAANYEILEEQAFPADFEADTHSIARRITSNGTIVLEVEIKRTGLTATDLDFAFEFSNSPGKNPNIQPEDYTFGPKAVIIRTSVVGSYELQSTRLEVITVPVADFNQLPWYRPGSEGDERFRFFLPAFLAPELHWFRVYPRARGGAATGIIRVMGGLNL